MRPILMRNLIAAAFALFSACALAAADLEAGKKKAEPCQACHSLNGNAESDAQYPRLAGQYADYLAKSIKAYKTGDRKSPIMAPFANPLSDEDINNLAAYFSNLPGKLDDLSKYTQGE